ncbi:hypothetical protein [Deinococcus radiotolerans]|uniref:Uncharacterized protein n=1 Tax=Deinococcus radiotolerans TaxID=1309407 RepID=A0ABQ2FJF4_9DEIO|nr:hypothetical protein [Deinococcus radiotolerans]GGL01675.1 hypothetical protein GCM10010844_20190 [Deinococcus radiotolerans]
MTDDPPRDPRAPATQAVTPTLTVALHPPQYAQILTLPAAARLDARLAHLHARTPDDALRATLRDAARLLGAHLTFRTPGYRADAHPWQADTALVGVSVRRATHLLHLRAAALHAPGAVLSAVSCWPGGTLLIARRGVIQAQLNLACDLDRLHLDDLNLDDLSRPGQGAPMALHAHRLRPSGQLEQWRTSGWPDP